MPNPKKRISIAVARRVAEDHGMDQVILLTWSRVDGVTHVVTYGRTTLDCEQAAQGGNAMKRVMGWPPADCEAEPFRIRHVRLEELERAMKETCISCRDGVPVFIDEDGDRMHTAAEYCEVPAAPIKRREELSS